MIKFKDRGKDKKVNAANKLTISRIFLVFPAVFFVLCEWIPHRWIGAFFVFLLASFTDYLDGKIARKYNYITDFGKIMDPLADKMLTISMYICFVGLGISSILPVVLIVIREFLITSVRFLVSEKKNVVISANIFGKLKTISQIVTIGAVMLTQIYMEMFSGNYYTKLNFVIDILIWISCVFSIVSGVVYLYQSKKILSSN